MLNECLSLLLAPLLQSHSFFLLLLISHLIHPLRLLPDHNHSILIMQHIPKRYFFKQLFSISLNL